MKGALSNNMSDSVVKKCNQCGEIKPIEQFDWKDKPRRIRQYHCRVCARDMSKRWYKRHRKEQIERAKKQGREVASRFQEWKTQQKCKQCGETRTCCLTFHHRDRSKKDFTISSSVRRYGKEKMQKELEKCDVLCFNCHAALHFGSQEDFNFPLNE